MITEAIIKFMFTLPRFLITLIPTLEIPNLMENNILSFLANIIASVAYFLPMPTLIACLTLIITVRNFHAIWALIQRIWDGLPLT